MSERDAPSQKTRDLARSSNFVMLDGRLDADVKLILVRATKKEKGKLTLDTRWKP